MLSYTALLGSVLCLVLVSSCHPFPPLFMCAGLQGGLPHCACAALLGTIQGLMFSSPFSLSPCLQDSKKDYRTVLSRAYLLGSIQGILNLVVPEVRQIFELLTAEFSPLELCSRLAPLMTRLEEMTHTMSPASPVKDVALGQYVESLKQVR